MAVIEIEHTERTEKTKAEVIELLEENEIPYCLTECYGGERICIALSKNTDDEQICCDCAITILTCNKDVCKIYPHEILYIAIENRNSVIYLTDRILETHYSMDYWKTVLDEKVFAQPHYSYIVNLNYVDEVTKDFVKIKYKNKEHSVYTSSRRVGTFKKAVLNFRK